MLRNRLSMLLCALALAAGMAVSVPTSASAATLVYGCSYPNGYITTTSSFQVWMHRQFYGYYSCKCIGAY